MIRNIVFLLILLESTVVFSQSGTASPYSFSGLGDINFRGTQVNRFMGDLDVYNDSIHVNLNNPGAYGDLKLTNYSLGLNYRSTKMTSSTDSNEIATSSLDYISVAIPTNKFGFGFGIIPYTSVGYQLSNIDNSASPTLLNRYQGEGGVNKVFMSFGFRSFKHFTFGATLNYDFGELKYKTLKFVDGVELGTILENKSNISGFDIKLSANVDFPFNKKLTMRGMISYAPDAKLTSNNTRIFYTQSTNSQEGNYSDIEEIDLDSRGLAKTKVNLASSLSIGTGIGQERKWFLGTQYSLTKTSGFKNNFIEIPNISYSDASKISVGAFYIPSYASLTSYFKRIVYRIGFRYENTGISVNNFGLKETGVTFGLGLPLANYSNVNIGMEYGSRGTTTADLIKEKYWSIRVGFSLNDRWFVKRKYN